MRGLVVVGLSVLALGASVMQAEARFRMRIGGGHAAPVRSAVSSTPGLAVIPGLTLRSDGAPAKGMDSSAAKPVGLMTAEALAPGEAGSLKIPTVGPAAAPATALKKSDEPWCRSGRTTGSGVGFCLIN